LAGAAGSLLQYGNLQPVFRTRIRGCIVTDTQSEHGILIGYFILYRFADQRGGVRRGNELLGLDGFSLRTGRAGGLPAARTAGTAGLRLGLGTAAGHYRGGGPGISSGTPRNHQYENQQENQNAYRSFHIQNLS
jgi:hypothetical protein